MDNATDFDSQQTISMYEAVLDGGQIATSTEDFKLTDSHLEENSSEGRTRIEGMIQIKFPLHAW